MPGDLLAQLDAELVERVDAHQHRVGKGAVFVEGDQRAQRRRVEVVEQDRRLGPVARIAALRIVARARPPSAPRLARSSSSAASGGARRRDRRPARHGDEFDRDEVRALVEQLEDRVLRVGPPPPQVIGAVGRSTGWPSAVTRLAVRFHFELLEIAREQPQPLVIGEDRARLGTRSSRHRGGLRTPRAPGHILRGRGKAEVAVHLRRAFEQGLERVPAERQSRAEADRTPQRIAPADPLTELENPGFVDPLRDGRFGLRGDRDELPIRIG